MFTPLSLGKHLPAISIKPGFFNLGWQELLIAYPITILYHFTQETSHIHHTTKFSLMKCSHWSRLLRNLKQQGMLDCHTFLIFPLLFFLPGIWTWWVESWQPPCDHKPISRVLNRHSRILVTLLYISSKLPISGPLFIWEGEESTSLWCHIYYKHLFLPAHLNFDW